MRLSIEITSEQHQFLKTAAAIQGKSIKEFILDSALPNHEEQAAFKALEALISKRQQNALSGNLSTKTLNEILSEELQEKD